MGDAYTSGETQLHNFDLAGAYESFLSQIEDNQVCARVCVCLCVCVCARRHLRIGIGSHWKAQKRARFGLSLHFVFVRRACLGKLSCSNDDSNHQQYLNRNAPWFRLISEIGPSAAAQRLPFPRLCAGLRALLRRSLPPAVLAGVGQRLSYAGLVGV